MMSLMLTLFCLAPLRNILVSSTQFFDSSPGCFASCSNQVNCTITYGFCGGSGSRLNMSQGPDIAAEPVDLKVEKKEDGEYQYVNLQWRPPEDGSYNYLTGFLVQVTVISLDPVHTGVRGTTCFQVLPASNWYGTHKSLHRRGGVVFFLNCLRFQAQASMDLVISIHSLPLNSEEPKLAMTKVNIEPADATMWNPHFDKWADSDDVMHLVIQNPLREARFYGVQIKSVDRDMMVFSHVFTAFPGNQSQDKLYLYNKEGLPHFVIPGLSKEDNYSILMDVLDANKTAIAHMRSIRTNPFKLNFTSLALATSAQSHHGLDNSFIIIVSVVVVVVVAILVCLIWKGVFRPSKLRSLVRNCAVKKNTQHRHRSVSFLPIYCDENEQFTKAVESHVSLLRRCIESNTSQNGPPSDNALCCFNHNDHHQMVEDKNNDSDFIIYLSPGLGKILQFGQTCPSPCSRLDALCHQKIQALAEHHKLGHGPVPIVATFDCFQQMELSCLNDLIAAIFPSSPGLRSETLTPVILASLSLGGWRVENLDILYQRLCRHQEFTTSSPLCFQGWRECEEARAVERHLSNFCEAQRRGNADVTASWDHKFAASPNLQLDRFSSNLKRSQDNLYISSPERLERGRAACGMSNNQGGVTFLPNSPLFNSSGFQSLSEARSSTTSLHHDNRHNNSLKTPGDVYNVKLPTADTVSNDVGNHGLSYYHSPTELRGYYGKNSNETADSGINFQGRQGLHPEGVVIYKPNVFYNNIESVDSTSMNSEDSDTLLRTNDLNGYVRRRDQFTNEEPLNKEEFVIQKSGIKIARHKDAIVPPTLNHSNFTSMESVCERINRVNEFSGWSQPNLSK